MLAKYLQLILQNKTNRSFNYVFFEQNIQTQFYFIDSFFLFANACADFKETAIY